MGDELRITVQLIDVQNDEHLWSEDYDRKFENVFSLQKEIAQRVAASLKVSIFAKESKEIGKRPTLNLEAYTLYLKGRSYRHRLSLDALKKSIDYCQQAIDKDPSFAQAYAEIARCYAWMALLELMPAADAHDQARKFAERAIQADSSIPESHLSLGLALLHKRDFRSAEAEFRRALDLNPSFADCHLELAGLLAITRRFQEAVLESRRALELDPLSPSTCTYAGTWIAIAHRHDEAIELLQNAIELDPNSVFAHDNLGYCYVEKGLSQQGISEIKRSIELGGGVMQWNDLAYSYAKAGEMDEVRTILRELLNLRERGERTDVAIAGVYTSLGNHDKAIEWLERALRDDVGYFLAINCELTFERLRGDPRFLDLLKRAGFPE